MQILTINQLKIYSPTTGELIYDNRSVSQGVKCLAACLEFEDDGISDIYAGVGCPSELKEFVDSMEYEDFSNCIYKTIFNMPLDNIICILVNDEGEVNKDDEDDFVPDHMAFLFVKIN